MLSRTSRTLLLGSVLALGTLATGAANAQDYRRWDNHGGGYQRWNHNGGGYQRWSGGCWNCGFWPGVAVGVGVGTVATLPYTYTPYTYAPYAYSYPAPAYYGAPYPYYGGYYNMYQDRIPGYVPPGNG